MEVGDPGVHGDRDEFGSVENLRPLVERVAQKTDAELVIFPNCGHFFDEHLNELRDTMGEWASRKISDAGR